MGCTFPTTTGTRRELFVYQFCGKDNLVLLQIMYQGVLKDDERRREKRRQREEELLSSQRKRELYERVQKVEKSMDQPS
jgi:hypothetical protein